MSQPKYQIEDIVYHTEKKLYMLVDSFTETEKGILYALKPMIPTHDARKGTEDEWKRYYEEKIDRVCARIARKSASDVVFAKLQE